MWQVIIVYIILAWAVGTVFYKLVKWSKAFSGNGSACSSCSSGCSSKQTSQEPDLVSIDLPNKK